MKATNSTKPFTPILIFRRHLFTSRMVGPLLIGLIFVSRIAFAAPSVVEGIVKDSKGQVISGADIRIERKGGSNWNKIVKTDATGHFVHSDLEAGTYRVTLFVNGSVKASINNVTTKVGKSTQLNFDLKTSTSARGLAAGQANSKHTHMIYLPPQTGSHLGGWVAVKDDGSVDTAGTERVEKKSGEALQKFQSRTGVVAQHEGSGAP